MIAACLLTIVVAFAIACPLTWLMRGVGRRVGQMDAPGDRKIHDRPIPATGGVAIFAAIGLLFAAAIASAWVVPESLWRATLPEAVKHLPGMRTQTAMGLTLLAALAALHVTGLIDDRRGMGPMPKLAIQIVAAAALATFFDVRLLTLLGPIGSIAATVVWFVIITNAMNFLDNMDGLSAGVGVICAGLLLGAALGNGQWFVAAVLAMLIGALLGFLVFNYPPASIFMGDGGSLVLGFALAFCSVRITYLDTPIAYRWWAVLTPLVVLSIPLYDFTSVVILRLLQGRSPFVGDTQHFSHRLTQKGLSRRAAVGVIWACALATGIGGVMLAQLEVAWMAMLVIAQTAAVLLVLALLEHKTPRREDAA